MDLEELEQCGSKSGTGVLVKKLNIHLALLPFSLGDIQKGVDDELSSRLYKYHRDFDGMLLHYQDVKLPKSGPKNDEGGNVHLTINAKVFVFRPVRGVVTTGIVTNFSKGHIGCRILNQIAATVFTDQQEVDSHVAVGAKIEFRLTKVTHRHFDTNITGDFISILDSKPLLALLDQSEEMLDTSATTTSSAKKRKKKKKEEREEADNTCSAADLEVFDVKQEEEVEEGGSGKKKKKKKDKKRSLEVEGGEEEDSQQKIKKVKTEPGARSDNAENLSANTTFPLPSPGRAKIKKEKIAT